MCLRFSLGTLQAQSFGNHVDSTPRTPIHSRMMCVSDIRTIGYCVCVCVRELHVCTCVCVCVRARACVCCEFGLSPHSGENVQLCVFEGTSLERVVYNIFFNVRRRMLPFLLPARCHISPGEPPDLIGVFCGLH